MCRKAGLCIVQDPSYQMNVTRNACSRKRERIETTSAPQASPTGRAYCVCGSEAFAKSARPSAVDSTCLYTNVWTPPLLFGPATYDCFQLLLVEFDLERFSHKFSSCQRWGSLLQYRTSSGIDNSIKVSVHKLHAFLAVVEPTNASSPRTCAVCAICCSISSPCSSIAGALRWLFSISIF